MWVSTGPVAGGVVVVIVIDCCSDCSSLMSSLTEVLMFSSGDWENVDVGECGNGGWWLVAVVGLLPAWFRFAQCLRRYR